MRPGRGRRRFLRKRRPARRPHQLNSPRRAIQPPRAAIRGHVMATRYPPKGDPRRPIELAVNAARTLGVVSLIIGVLLGCALGFLSGRAPGGTFALLGVALAAAYIVPGILYLLF